MSFQNKPTVSLSKASKRNLRKKEHRAIKKAKFENLDISVGDNINPTSDIIINLVDEREDIFYNPLKHKTQNETRKVKKESGKTRKSKEESREYIRSYWKSEDFVASDLKSTNKSQSTVLMDPKVTFFEKFAEKRRQRQVIKRLLDQGLLPLDAVKPNTFTLKYDSLSNFDLENIWNELYNGDTSTESERSLPLQTTQTINPILNNFQIPAEFINLLESEIFDSAKLENKNSDQVWKQFGLWAFFANSTFIGKQIRNHCQCLWSKVKYVHQKHLKVEKGSLDEIIISEAISRDKQEKKIMARELTNMMLEKNINIMGYHHIFDPQCFKNAFGETLVDFYIFQDLRVAKNAREAVQQYFVHMLNEPSHQSKEFSKKLVEHFGAFTGSNNEPYTTSNTASSHNKKHLKCVQGLIQGLQPLSDAVNGYIRNTYPALHEKMRKLDLGPNVPKSFGDFPTVAVNFNIISQFHQDVKDHSNSLCVVCPLGIFKGGQLVFPELKLVVHVKEGQAVAFRSNILVHGNFPVLTGIRHSVVFFVHGTTIKQGRKFGSLFSSNDDTRIRTNIKKKRTKSLKPGSQSLRIKNSRRSHLNLERAKRGLPATYRI